MPTTVSPIVAVLWDPGTQGNQGVSPEWQTGAPDVCGSSPLVLWNTHRKHREGAHRWHLLKKEKKEKIKKMVPNSFSKPKHESMEDSACWKAKNKRKKKKGHLLALARQRDCRKMVPTSLCPQSFSAHPYSTDQHFKISKLVSFT